MQIEISASKRTLQGKGASRRLRGSGKVPGVIYGGENPAEAIELDHNSLYHQLKLEAFHASILSMDVEDWKLKNTKLRARRAGVSIIEPKVIEGNKTIKRLKETADRLLLDVPCSGLGVLKRNPDTKWKLSPESIDKVVAVQQEIIQNYSSLLKPGGIMVYATCSILPIENQDQITAFLESEKGQNFELLEDQKVLAHESGFDGFYIAKLKKK